MCLYLWVCYHQKLLRFAFLILKVLCYNPGERLASLGEVWIAVGVFLVKYVVVFVVSENLVEVEVALAAGVTAAVVVAVAFADVVFDYDYIVCVAVDVVVLVGYVVLFVDVAVDDAGVLTAAHVDA